MKKLSFVVMFSLFLTALALSCASNPPPPPPPEPDPPPVVIQEQPEEEPTIEEVYEKYSGDIILEGAKTHRVVWRETLTGIAKRYYGSANGYYFPLILLASSDVAKDPDLIVPGNYLTVPDLRRNLDDPGARQKLKEFLNEIADVYNSRLGKKWGARSRNQLKSLAATL